MLMLKHSRHTLEKSIKCWRVKTLFHPIHLPSNNLIFSLPDFLRNNYMYSYSISNVLNIKYPFNMYYTHLHCACNFLSSFFFFLLEHVVSLFTVDLLYYFFKQL